MNEKPDGVDPAVDTLLNDFVFRDCRLGEHPKVRARVGWLEGDVLVMRDTAPPNVDLADDRIPLEHSVSGRACRTNQVMVVSAINAPGAFTPPFLQSMSIRSLLAVPLSVAPNILGVLHLGSTDENFFSEADIGRSQLLGALLVYSRFRRLRISSPVTADLGLALKRVREELGLTQLALAERLGQSRVALSQCGKEVGGPHQ